VNAEPKVRIAVDHGDIAGFCRRNGVRRLAFFGSVLRDDFSPESDVDVLVEFLPDARVSLFDMARMENELAAIIGRTVDLRTLQELSRYFRDDVAAEAVEEYVA
jgi:predicted nucleotidyltransferase